MNELTTEQIHERLAAYALGALEAEEMIEVDQYLQTHRGLIEELERLDDLTAQLAHAAPAVPLPPQIKGQLMARVRAEAAPAVPAAPATPMRAPSGPGLLERLAGWLTPAQQAGLVTALLALMIVGGGTAFNASRQAAERAAQITAARSELAGVIAERDALLASQLTDAQLALLAAPSSAVPLPGTEAAPAAAGRIYSDGQAGLLVLQGLAALSDDQIYQLWLIPADGAPVPSGLIAVAERGTTLYDLSLPGVVSDFAAVGLSIEPAGGSPAPTGPIVLLGEVG